MRRLALRLQLRFPDEAESRFAEAYRTGTITATRLALALAIVLYALFAILDLKVMPLSKPELWLIRFAVVCPILILVLALTYVPSLARQTQVLVFTAVLAAGLGIVAMLAVAREEERGFPFYVMGLLLVIMWAYGFTRLRFLAAAMAGLIILAAYEVVALTHTWSLLTSDRTTTFVIHNFFLISANIIGLFTGYMLERHARNEFLQKEAISSEHEKADRLLLNILPERIAARLKDNGQAIAEEFGDASVLFADVVDFTPFAERQPPAAVVGMLNELFSEFDVLASRHQAEKIKTIGDCYMAATGVPAPQAGHAALLADLALEMMAFVRGHRFQDRLALDLRIGIASGPVTAGIIGRRKFIYDLWGDTVNTASRMESHGRPGTIQVTQATRDLLENEFHLTPVGAVPVKGKGEIAVWELTARKAPLPAPLLGR